MMWTSALFQTALIATVALAYDATNFNECLPVFAGTQACAVLQPNEDENGFNLQDLPETLVAIETCCDNLRVFIESKCSCHRGFDVLFEYQLPLLTGICKIINPWEWRHTPILGPNAPQCKKLKTYNQGCGGKWWIFHWGDSDMELEARRLESLNGLRALFPSGNDCLNTPEFVEMLSHLATENIETNVPYGIGKYKGYAGSAEYLGISIGGLNHGLWNPVVQPNVEEEGNQIAFLPDGSLFTQSVVSGHFLDKKVAYENFIQGTINTYTGCEARFDTIDVVPTDGMAKWVELFTQVSMKSKRYGAEDVCKIHETYCAGKTGINGQDLTQFESTAKCMEYMGTLPAYSEQCGSQRPLAGNSLPCRFKHHFMVPTNPSLHCPHIGVAGTVDQNGFAKCTDELECSEPAAPGYPANADAVSWLPDFDTLIQQDNVGWEEEPLGCGFSTESGEYFGPPL